MSDVHVSRVGFTPLKGCRHADHPGVDLEAEGPVGDREFCLVDRSTGRVLRTVENPGLMTTVARWQDGWLTADLPSGTVTGRPVSSGETLKLDYWGRVVALDLVEGPWASAFSDLLGRRVELARSRAPGDIVYGAPVSLVTTSSLDRLSAESGVVIDGAQFRGTFTVDTAGQPAHVEDDWVGRTLRLGEAEVTVRDGVPRCAVVDLDPVTGERRAHTLRVLAGYRRALGELAFGVDAVVTRPGRVDVGARVAAVERG